MMIPLNRWTIGLGVVLVSWLGGDVLSQLLQVIQFLSQVNSPAL